MKKDMYDKLTDLAEITPLENSPLMEMLLKAAGDGPLWIGKVGFNWLEDDLQPIKED